MVANDNTNTPLRMTVRDSPEVLPPAAARCVTPRVPRVVRFRELAPLVLLGRTRGTATTSTSGGASWREQSARYLKRR